MISWLQGTHIIYKTNFIAMAGYDKRRINTEGENLIAYGLESSPRFAGYGFVLIKEFHHNDCLVVKRESKGGHPPNCLGSEKKDKWSQ